MTGVALATVTSTVEKLATVRLDCALVTWTRTLDRVWGPGTPGLLSTLGTLRVRTVKLTVHRSVPGLPPGGLSTTGPAAVRTTPPLASGGPAENTTSAQAVPGAPMAESTMNTPGSGVGQGLAAVPGPPQEGVMRS